jgi:hypothetical protein
MESILRDEITEHLAKNKLIKGSQHGFMKDRSCVSNLLEFLEKATTVVDEGEGFDAIYLDFAKAFDKVPKERLLRKVRAHGVRGRVLEWIRSWLSGRKQRVVLNGKVLLLAGGLVWSSSRKCTGPSPVCDIHQRHGRQWNISPAFCESLLMTQNWERKCRLTKRDRSFRRHWTSCATGQTNGGWSLTSPSAKSCTWGTPTRSTTTTWTDSSWRSLRKRGTSA